MNTILLLLFALAAAVQSDVVHLNGLGTILEKRYIRKNSAPVHLSRANSDLTSYSANTQTYPQQQYLPLDNNVNGNVAAFELPSEAATLKQHAVSAKSTKRYRPRVKVPKKPIVTKAFYVHEAPEETDEEVRAEIKQLEDQPRKHFNVLFVKAPAQTSKSAAVNLAKVIKGDEKTVVYVLSKKTTATELRDAINENTQQQQIKPDVFFIKYRTPEEAAHAQHEIQSQYNQFEGPSTIYNEGISPIASVVGTLDPAEEQEEEVQEEDEQEESALQTSVQPEQAPQVYYQQSYLPPSPRIR